MSRRARGCLLARVRATAALALPAAALVAALLLPACRRDPGRRAAEEQAAATARDLDLPRVRSAGLAPLGSHSRVILRPEGIDADNIALIRSLPSDVGKELYESLPPEEAAALPVVHRQLVPLARWAAPPEALDPASLEIRPLRRPLDYMASIDRKITSLDPSADPGLRLNINAAADAPYELLLRVLATAGQAGFDTWALAVRGPQGEEAIPIHTLSSGARPDCIAPALKLGPRGITVRVERRTIVGAPGACPSVPRKDGRHDLDALLSLLRRISEAAPGCGAAYLEAELQAPWGEVAPVLTAVTAEAHYNDIALAAPRIGAPDAGADCSGAIEPEALSASAKQEAEGADAGAPPPDDAGTVEESPFASMQSRKSPRPAGSVAIGGSGASNQVPNAPQVIAGMRAGFRMCYGRALAEDPKVAGSIRVTAKIGPGGEVLSATHAGHKLPQQMVSCVLARVESALFSPPPGGGAVIIIPISFQPP